MTTATDLLHGQRSCSPALTDTDDRRHHLGENALQRESLIFLVFVPEENVGVIAYTWVNGANEAGAMGLVFGRDNERFGQFHVEGVPAPPEADFDDWRVGPLRVRHGTPHREAHVSFVHEGISLDYHFRATTPAFSYADNRGGCPDWLADNRLEQSGLVTGSIKLEDREVVLDTTGHRDHSWGRRDWTAIHQYRWVNVQAGPDIAINFLNGSALDQYYNLGYVDRAGHQSPVVDVEVDIERDVDLYSYTSARFVLTDEAGRRTEIVAGERGPLAIWPAGGLESHDGAGPCTIDGVPGLIHIEEGWHPEFVERRRAMMAERFDSEESRQVLSLNRDIGSLAGAPATTPSGKA